MPQNLSVLDVEWPQSAPALAFLTKENVDMSKLIMAGVADIGSWLIEKRILGSVREKGIPQFEFGFQDPDHRTASLLPMPDGSAFARNPLGQWLALDEHETLSEVQYIGFRYATGNYWSYGFGASMLQGAGNEMLPLTPLVFARMWTEATGTQPRGYSEGLLDHVEALGLNVIDKLFHTRGRLGF